jgi:hypothetical protein
VDTDNQAKSTFLQEKKTLMGFVVCFVVLYSQYGYQLKIVRSKSLCVFVGGSGAREIEQGKISPTKSKNNSRISFEYSVNYTNYGVDLQVGISPLRIACPDLSGGKGGCSTTNFSEKETKING